MGNEEIRRVGNFKYLRFTISSNAGGDQDILNRKRVGWLKWRVAEGVLCDSRGLVKLKRQFYTKYNTQFKKTTGDRDEDIETEDGSDQVGQSKE